MKDSAAKDGFHQAVMWRGVDVLPRLRQMPPDERMRVMKQADEHNLREPLHLALDQYRFFVPAWGEELLTGAQVTALLVFGLWVHVGEDEERAAGLLELWPEIRCAHKFSQPEVLRQADTICT